MKARIWIAERILGRTLAVIMVAAVLSLAGFEGARAGSVDGVFLTTGQSDATIQVSGKDLLEPTLSRLKDPDRLLVVFPKATLAKGVKAPAASGPIRAARLSPKAAEGAKAAEVWLVLEVAGDLAASAVQADGGWSLSLGKAVSKTGTAAPKEAAETASVAAASGPTNVSGSVYRLVSVDSRMVDDEVRVVVTGDGTLVYRVAVKDNPHRVELDFLGAELALENPVLNVDKGSVKSVKALQIRKGADPMSRLTIALQEAVPHKVNKQSSNQIVIALSPAPVVEKPMPRKLNLNYRVSIDVQGQDLEGLCRAIVEEAGGEFGSVGKPQGGKGGPAGLNSPVNLKLRDAPLWKALIEILSPNKLAYYQDGNKIVIGPIAEIIARNKVYMAKEWESETIFLGDVLISEVAVLLKSFVSEGNVAQFIADQRRNALVVKGLHQDILEIKGLMELLDLTEADRTFVIDRIRLQGGSQTTAMKKVVSFLPPGNKLAAAGKSAGGVAGGSVVFVDKERQELILKGTPENIEEFKRMARKLNMLGEGFSKGTGDLETRVFYINWQDPVLIGNMVAQHLSVPITPTDSSKTAKQTAVGGVSSGGDDEGVTLVKLIVDAPENRLIVTDVSEYLDKAEALIKQLDVAARQVMIEAKLVEVTLGAIKEIGLDISGVGPNIAGKPTSGSSLLAGAVLGTLSFGILGQNIDLDATLTAMENQDKADVLSSPRIATKDGVQAVISSQRTVIYEEQTIILNPPGPPFVSSEFKKLPLPVTLRVTPRINQQGYIDMIIDANVTSQSGPIPEKGPPATTNQTATTNVGVKNGDTIVIGGLVREEQTTRVRKIPVLSLIPILGKLLFTNERKETRKVELIVFLTPQIMDNMPRAVEGAGS